MNLEIANRLVEYRKKAGLSQEELADKLGISRQAISKWERVEASPDTDNLIALANLYGISLDELIYGRNESNKEDKKEDIKEDKSEDPEQVVLDNEGIHIHGRDDDHKKVDVKIGRGVHVEVTKDGKTKTYKPKVKREHVLVGILSSLVSLSVVIAYLILGFTTKNGWAWYWPMFIAIPVLPSIVDAIISKRFAKFNYPCLVTATYLFLGMIAGLWNPWWVLFITIPIFYIIFGNLDKLIHRIPLNKISMMTMMMVELIYKH